MAVLIRCVDDDYHPHQRLVALKLATKSLSGEQVAHALLKVLSVEYQIVPEHVLSMMRDRA